MAKLAGTSKNDQSKRRRGGEPNERSKTGRTRIGASERGSWTNNQNIRLDLCGWIASGKGTKEEASQMGKSKRGKTRQSSMAKFGASMTRKQGRRRPELEHEADGRQAKSMQAGEEQK